MIDIALITLLLIGILSLMVTCFYAGYETGIIDAKRSEKNE